LRADLLEQAEYRGNEELAFDRYKERELHLIGSPPIAMGFWRRPEKRTSRPTSAGEESERRGGSSIRGESEAGGGRTI
jgi:hypothetical protein